MKRIMNQTDMKENRQYIGLRKRLKEDSSSPSEIASWWRAIWTGKAFRLEDPALEHKPFDFFRAVYELPATHGEFEDL